MVWYKVRYVISRQASCAGGVVGDERIALLRGKRVDCLRCRGVVGSGVPSPLKSNEKPLDIAIASAVERTVRSLGAQCSVKQSSGDVGNVPWTGINQYSSWQCVAAPVKHECQSNPVDISTLYQYENDRVVAEAGGCPARQWLSHTTHATTRGPGP
jgi:hypothetical protein